MPFNGSGDFSRVHNWQQDRDNGIKILALRMDQEFDNFQGGMNLTFLRNGLVPMTANLNLGTNYIIGLGSGSVGALPIRFADDPNTGLFLNGYNKLGLVSNGVLRLEANTTGVAMTGNMTNSGTFNNVGAITQNGQQVWHAGNLVNPVTTAGAAFVGGVSAPLFQIDPNYTMNLLGGNPLIVYDTNDYQYYDRASNVHGFAVAGVDRFTLSSVGASFTGVLAASGAITQNGNQVWHAGNLVNPASLTAPMFSTSLQVGLNGATSTYNFGFFPRSPGAGTVDWDFRTNDATFGAKTPMTVTASGNIGVNQISPAFTLDVTGSGRFTGPVGVGGTLGVTGAITQAGQQVWHAGNFNPSDYAPLASPAFTGTPQIAQSATPGTLSLVRNGVLTWGIGGYSGGGNTFGIQLNAFPPSFTINDAGNATLAGNTTNSGTFNAVGAITQNGNQVWHAGNFNPSSYATLANPALTGTPTAPTAATSTNTTQIATTAFVQAQLAATAMPLSGGAFTGNITRSGAGAYLNRGAAGLSAVVTQGTAAPSGGSDGDIYLQYT